MQFILGFMFFFWLAWVAGTLLLMLLAFIAFCYFLRFVYRLFSGEFNEGDPASTTKMLLQETEKQQLDIRLLEAKLKELNNE